jgi:hypothetical protein
MNAGKQTDWLPSRTHLTLSRPDVSAQEAVAIISDHAGDKIRQMKAFSVAIAGAADVKGRLNVANGAWDVRFLTSLPSQYVYARLFAGGNLSFTLESMRGVSPSGFELDGDWIDSTLAADSVKNESLPSAMGDRYSLFLSLQFVVDLGMVWEVRRTYSEPANRVLVTQSFAVNAANSDVAVEALEIKKAGVLVESRYRNRLDKGEWIDKLGH